VWKQQRLCIVAFITGDVALQESADVACRGHGSFDPGITPPLHFEGKQSDIALRPFQKCTS
jgi:hypothetical protein